MSTPIVVLASFAGGVGKTTLTHALAVACAEFGKKALVIDLDSSGALTFKLGHERTRENVINCDERFDLRPHTATDSLTTLIAEIPEKYDLVLVDSAPLFTAEFEQVLKAARLVISPVRESIHSLRGALAVMKLTSAPCKALPYFGANGSELAQLVAAELNLIDGEISISVDVLVAEAKTTSVLTNNKSCNVAQQYRDAAYSILEELKIFQSAIRLVRTRSRFTRSVFSATGELLVFGLSAVGALLTGAIFLATFMRPVEPAGILNLVNNESEEE